MHMHTIVVLEYQRQYAYEIVLYIILANMHTTLVEYARIYRMHSTVCILLLDLLATQYCICVDLRARQYVHITLEYAYYQLVVLLCIVLLLLQQESEPRATCREKLCPPIVTLLRFYQQSFDIFMYSTSRVLISQRIRCVQLELEQFQNSLSHHQASRFHALQS